MEKNDGGSPTPAAVAFRDVTKSFGSVVANESICFNVASGSIHGFIGENGAGKSTAMKMLYGMLSPDAGHILVDGRETSFRSSRDAMAKGVGMVHQHFMLADALTAWENVILGQEPASPWQRRLPRPLRGLNKEFIKGHLGEGIAIMGKGFDWDAPVSSLPVAAQQKLEICRLLRGQSRILILDEPTAVLTPMEAQDLFGILRRLKTESRTIILITHKLKEVMAITDQVTVMRQGRVVADRVTARTSIAELGGLMVGSARSRHRERSQGDIGREPGMKEMPCVAVDHVQDAPTVLVLEKVRMATPGGKARLADVTLTVREGEIVGVAGVQGSGQKALLDLLAEPRRYFRPRRRYHAGERLHAQGRIEVGGKDVSGFTGKQMRRGDLGFMAEDRQRESLLLEADLQENFLLGHHDRNAFLRKGLFIARRNVAKGVKAAITDFDIRPGVATASVRSLSGGNQQKLVVARELWHAPKLIVAAEPTRGVDIGAIELIHAKIRAARDRGAGVLLVSSDLDELMTLADRIIVLCDGHIVRTFTKPEFSEKELGVAMGGGQHE